MDYYFSVKKIRAIIKAVETWKIILKDFLFGNYDVFMDFIVIDVRRKVNILNLDKLEKIIL